MPHLHAPWHACPAVQVIPGQPLGIITIEDVIEVGAKWVGQPEPHMGMGKVRAWVWGRCARACA